jgi:hypothetical protein
MSDRSITFAGIVTDAQHKRVKTESPMAFLNWKILMIALSWRCLVRII